MSAFVCALTCLVFLFFEFSAFAFGRQRRGAHPIARRGCTGPPQCGRVRPPSPRNAPLRLLLCSNLKMKKKEANVKHSGQVFTPDYLVEQILDFAGYKGPEILRRHVMDNSCGDGAFLCAVVRRYAEAFLAASADKEALADELRTYVHGIEIDREACAGCIANLNAAAQACGISVPQWDVLCADALCEHRYDGRMDFVVGNPPYVRVHHLQQSYRAVKSYSFAAGGMTDLYLVFYEIGLNMLRRGGTLCYITPSSWLTSVAGEGLRSYLLATRCLKAVSDLAHFQPFEATTYTLIATLVKDVRHESFDYYRFDEVSRRSVRVARLSFDEAFWGKGLYLGTHAALQAFRAIRQGVTCRYVQVKNGFATLADRVFIKKRFLFRHLVIPTIKASTGRWAEAFFPYDRAGRPYPREVIFADEAVARYLNANKEALLKGRSEREQPAWFLYGRTQAIKDVWTYKVSVNSIIKDVSSLYLNEAPSGCGVYGGLYIVGCDDCELLRHILLTPDFVDYVKLLKKYKSGGYYTFSSKDLELYINYKLSTSQLTSTDEQQRVFKSHRSLF